MKIEVSHYEEKITMEMSDDIDATEMFRALCTVFVAVGYHPSNLEDCILDKAEEITHEADIKGKEVSDEIEREHERKDENEYEEIKKIGKRKSAK
jgi:hypothetical protein